MFSCFREKSLADCECPNICNRSGSATKSAFGTESFRPGAKGPFQLTNILFLVVWLLIFAPLKNINSHCGEQHSSFLSLSHSIFRKETRQIWAARCKKKLARRRVDARACGIWGRKIIFLQASLGNKSESRYVRKWIARKNRSATHQVRSFSAAPE